MGLTNAPGAQTERRSLPGRCDFCLAARRTVRYLLDQALFSVPGLFGPKHSSNTTDGVTPNGSWPDAPTELTVW
jgi:hypothetical protein